MKTPLQTTLQSTFQITRRGALALGGAMAAASLLSGCESLEQRLTKAALPPQAFPPQGLPAHSPALRLLHRAGYGPRPGDLAHFAAIGAEAWVDAQLAPMALEEDARLTWRLRRLGDILEPDPGLLFDQDDHRVVQALREAALLRAVYSRRQLQARMTEFWGDHFNIYAFKGQGPQLKVVDDAQIRPFALGKFRDLLGASARSAAMLGYLDNTANRKGVPNENYARELMELHTLVVRGGYTQADVREVARCLTGWTAEKRWHRGRFQFDASVHDPGAKQVLGTRLPAGGGVRDGERVLDILAAHPATARHLATKLCRRFRGDESPQWVSRLSGIYQKTGGDIAAMLRPLLLSPDFGNAPPIFKRPLDYVVSALRALDADTDGGAGVQGHLEAMGQALFAWPMPDGFPEGEAAWTGAMVPRWNFALALAGGTTENTTLDLPGIVAAGEKLGLTTPDAILELVFGGVATDPALADVRAQARFYPSPREFAAVALMSPAFGWR